MKKSRLSDLCFLYWADITILLGDGLESVSSRSCYSSSRRIPGTPHLSGVVCSSVLKEEGRVRKRLSLFILFSFLVGVCVAQYVLVL